MLLDIITKGSVDQSVEISIIDSTDGTPETGVVYNTSGIDLWYRRQGAAKTSITEASLSALTDAHTDGGILHIGDGVYRLDLPDAAWASGADWVAIGGTVTGMIVIGGRVRLADQRGLKRAVAVPKFVFEMTDSTTHLPATGLTVSAAVRKDGGSSAALADSVTELANGLYEVDLSASEMDGKTVALRFTATGADALNITLITE
ncbi:MAG: hypothetical protein U1F25_13690 [Rubrivivax sp.]